MPAYHDPDDQLVVVFKNFAIEDPLKSLEAGRPIFKDVEHCVITSPGSPDIKCFPATDFARWVTSPYGGVGGQYGQVKQSYAERFRHQYQQFKANMTQTKNGTPLDHAPFLSEARRAELKAQNVYTVEALADIEGNELKNLGPGGREMKNQAMAYIAESKVTAPTKQMLAELEGLRARNAVLEEDNQIKREYTVENEFNDMSDKQLRDFIATNTGQAPQGNLARRTLVRMAMDARPKEVAA